MSVYDSARACAQDDRAFILSFGMNDRRVQFALRSALHKFQLAALTDEALEHVAEVLEAGERFAEKLAEENRRAARRP